MRCSEGETAEEQIENLANDQMAIDAFMDFAIECLRRRRGRDGQLGKAFQ